MNKRAAGQYLDSLFGKRTGYAAVAYKDKGQSWQEQTFAWPRDRTKLLKWAEIHQDANVFICPALRQSPVRIKGDMQSTRWLWADVDWDKVPADRQSEVLDRIERLGTLVVQSGSGDNRHVYVQLDRDLERQDHFRLNAGLRDYLYADAKHADNSLLRLPGTTNWKTEVGSPVEVYTNDGDVHTVDDLMKIRAFAKARKDVDVSSVAWTPAEVSELPRRIRSMCQMTSEEAIARYGNRHKAVWAVTGELHKRGLEPDQIHTLMDTFPPALDKNDDEHNGYDVHRDVEKRLIWDRANEVVEEEPDEDEGFELASEQDDLEEFQREVDLMAQVELRRMAARKRAKEIEAERGWIGPPDDVSWSLTDALSNPPKPVPHLIDGLVGANHNVVLTAQYKTGKTKFIVASLARSLADAEPFLDSYQVNVEDTGCVVGHWNCEMDPDEMLDAYIRPSGYENTDNLVVANLRGHRVNLLTTLGRQWAVNWLTTRNVKVWTIDSLARLARMAGVSEKDNDEMFDLLMALDEIKVEAGVDVIFLITHTGRSEMEEGKERARGATAIDDWADARWILTKMDTVRFLRVEGRGVGLPDTSLLYDEDTGRSVAGFGGKEEVKADGGVQMIVRVVGEKPGITQSELYGVLKGKMSQRVAQQYVEDAVDAGFVEVKMSRGRGKPSKRHYLTNSQKPEGDRSRRATPGVVDMRPVGRPRGRRKSVRTNDGVEPSIGV